MNKLRQNWRRLVEGIAVFFLIGCAFEGVKHMANENAFGVCMLVALVALVCYLVGWIIED